MATIPLFVVNENQRRIARRRRILENLSTSEILDNCGLDHHGIQNIVELFESVEGSRKFSIPLETKVISFLSYLRSGNFQYSVGLSSGISQKSVSRIIEECTNVLVTSARNYVKFPTTIDETNYTKLKFSELCRTKGFPNVLGTVDGTHIGITYSKEDESRYVNRKGFHSINCQVVVDAEFRFLDVVAKWPGSTHDSVIWRESGVKQKLSQGLLGSGWFLGNSIVIITNYIMKQTNLSQVWIYYDCF